ncbi:MAG: glycine--tRNA ligase [Patescibacteria group bacterium]|nr:glycine--tRNA ligase [Patescibacteria group bacterium]
MAQLNKSMEKLVSLTKRRGFIYSGSEIYGGLASTYDYGPLGVELKNNIKNVWWKLFVQDREDIVGIDGGIILSPKVWEASGHINEFKDPLVECKKCHHRFRPDKLKGNQCPDCGGELTKEKLFSGMFETTIGPVKEEGILTYLRPETAQAIFINFNNVLSSTNVKIPFGIAQIGKAFRNEITTGNFIFRTIEFEQMEIEYFISPKENWEKVFNSFLKDMHKYAEMVGISNASLYDHDIPEKERAHYSKKTIDIEYEWPFGRDELWGLAYRTNYDLTKHSEYSEQNMDYFDDETRDKYIPHVIEPSCGVDRTVLAVLASAYDEEKLEDGEERIVLRLKPEIAPYKVAVFPLLRNKPDIVKKAREVYLQVKSDFSTFWDERGNIGKRYRYQDEIGTPFCLTVDFDTLDDDTVTVRDRDTMKQIRVKISELKDWFASRL